MLCTVCGQAAGDDVMCTVWAGCWRCDVLCTVCGRLLEM